MSSPDQHAPAQPAALNGQELRAYRFLEVHDLRIARRGHPRPLLEGISFALDRGQFGIVVGRSGVGKSLLFRAILGLLPSDCWRVTGSIRFRGYPLLTENGYQGDDLQRFLGRSIMAVFQEPSSHLHPSLTIGWQLKEMWEPRSWLLRREVRHRARRLLDRVSLVDQDEDRLLSRFPFQLSQGQQQRVMIAMALCGAELVLADEPTSALDQETENQIVRLLEQLRARRLLRSMLAVTHNLGAYRPLLRPDDWILEIEHHRGVGRARSPRTIASSPATTPISAPEHRPLLPSEAPILEVDKLSVKVGGWYRSRSILEGVSFTVSAGECFSITGPSGSGKTTLAKALVGLLPTYGGRILFRPPGCRDPIDLTDRAQGRGCGIRMIFQDALSTFNPKMTVGDTLREVLHYAGVRNPCEQMERIEPLLEKLGLARGSEAGEVLGRLPSQFSGGQRQRLGVARALLLRPRIVIGDEPFASQDVETSREMVTLFQNLQEQYSITFLLISHDQRLVRLLCERGIQL